MTPTSNRPGSQSFGALQPYGLTILRVVIGIVFFAHGYLKFFKMGIGGTIGFFTHLGIPLPTVMAWLVCTPGRGARDSPSCASAGPNSSHSE